MLKNYENPKMLIIHILDEDVITTSNSNSMTNQGELPGFGDGEGAGSTPWGE